MSHRRFAIWLVLTVVSAGLVAGCGSDKLPGGVSEGVVSVGIQGPASIAPGESAQYAVIERLSNGTTRAQSDATWASSDSSLVQVTSSGVATALSGAGEIVLSVKTTMSASTPVLVLPPDTFRLVGLVTDTHGAAIPNALVEVIGGPSATTGSNGAYRLYGVPPVADVRVTRGGYAAVEQHVQLNTHTSFNFRMPAVTAVVAGTLGVSQKGTGDRVEYVFAVKLTESNGVPATVTAAWIHLDSGWSGECSFDVASLGETRVPANGTLDLGPLTCPGYGAAYDAVVSFNLTDDNGHKLQLFLWWGRKL